MQSELNVVHIHGVQEADPLEYNWRGQVLKELVEWLTLWPKVHGRLDHSAVNNHYSLFHLNFDYVISAISSMFINCWSMQLLFLFIHDISSFLLLNLLSKVVAHPCYIMNLLQLSRGVPKRTKAKESLRNSYMYYPVM